ncbi:MAG: hypothetical protein WDZ59_10945 [Pirellulales bacterium]
MHAGGSGTERDRAFHEVLGYLNFSSGASDVNFLRSLDALYRVAAEERGTEQAAVALRDLLASHLDKLSSQGGAFADDVQVRAVLGLLFEHFLPAYRNFHRDLLFHQEEPELWQPFFLGRAAEAILRQGSPWDEADRIVEGALSLLNDYVGYRPVAVLENERHTEPYAHEWVRPIPLFIVGADVAAGGYERLIEQTLNILRRTTPDLLTRAWFDPELLDELALDPRAYDFDHPVNKRPNYHFGQWDPHSLDNQGRYRRFIVQQITLDALLSRVEEAVDAPPEELLYEAAAVLAGTILMASGISGSGPESHDSSTTLGTLLPQIAAYRDDFYAQLLAGMHGPHGERLGDEAAKLRQPLGGARQHLNHQLARRRAVQLQRVHLAQLFARMGYPEAALRQAHSVRVASARMLSQIYCRLTAGHHAIDAHRIADVAQHLPQIESLLKRGIECGALVDPWNIVGFGGNFSLFPAVENSVRDYRVDELIDVMEQIFALCSRAWSEAAAVDDAALEKIFADFFASLAAWWDQFAVASVGSLKPLIGKEEEISTNLVAGALNAWHKAGASAGDVGFWRMFVEQFDSPKAFSLVIEALLEKRDHVASMALMMQWLNQAETVPLAEGDSAFHRVALRWMHDVQSAEQETAEVEGAGQWPLVEKFFAFLEANAQAYWEVPQLQLTSSGGVTAESEAADHEIPAGEDDDDDFLFNAAYEEMTYSDSTDDGVEGDIFESGPDTSQFELEEEGKRISQRLGFLATLARLWQIAAAQWGGSSADHREEIFSQWRERAATNYEQLQSLLTAVHRFRIPAPSGSHESLVQYDRHRMVKEALLERIVATCVETAEAARYLQAAGGDLDGDEDVGTALFRAVLAGEPDRVRVALEASLESLAGQQLLYVPLARGGDPRQIVHVRSLQQMLHELVGWLPKLGLIRETTRLLEVAQAQEVERPAGPGAVTEFDRLFENGHRAIVETIVASAESWNSAEHSGRRSDEMLVECLQQLTENQLDLWLRHSRTLRLSVVERINSKREWQHLIDFIQRYGHDIFTQQFLNVGNLRAILHQGTERWLERMEQSDDDDVPLLIRELDTKIPRTEAAKVLTFVFEAVVENHAEYRDYNSTTTQSDHGELLYTLIDFLRLRCSYDRVAWNLKPVVMAHEVLVRRGRGESAELWRRALAERTSEVADTQIGRLKELCQKYGMRLPTISDRLAERFVRPLVIDRIRALVRPAIEDASAGKEPSHFSLLEQEVEELAKEPSGAGLDAPAWLVALEEEVTVVRSAVCGGSPRSATAQIEPVRLSWEEIQAQLAEAPEA